MNVKIIATKSCSRRLDLERELQQLGVVYEIDLRGRCTGNRDQIPDSPLVESCGR